MELSSLIFIFLFLPVFIIFYMLSPGLPGKNKTLLIFSLIFYGWAGPMYLLLLLAEVFCAWFIGIRIQANKRPPTKMRFFRGGTAFLIILIIIFRYFNLISAYSSQLFGIPKEATAIILPVGIAFYTLELISYMADVRRGEIEAETRYSRLLLFTCCFATVSGGVIVRYSQVGPELIHRKARAEDWAYGIRRFCIGLGKKVLLAGSCASVVERLLPQHTEHLLTVPVLGLWVGVLFFMIEIYLDLSAYSDMAIGLGRMLGFHYAENFDYPYMAGSIREFWSKWFTTLTAFFADYVYPPLGDRPKLNGNRNDGSRHIPMLILVWMLIGFWHGPGFNYLIWGLFFCLLIILESSGIFDALPAAIRHILTLLAVFIGWSIFRFPSLGNLGLYLRSAIGFNSNGFINDITAQVILNNLILLVVCALACTPLFKKIGETIRERLGVSHSGNTLIILYDMVVSLILLILSCINLTGADFSQYLFFRF